MTVKTLTTYGEHMDDGKFQIQSRMTVKTPFIPGFYCHLLDLEYHHPRSPGHHSWFSGILINKTKN